MLTGQFADHTLKELWFCGQSQRFPQAAALRLLAGLDTPANEFHRVAHWDGDEDLDRLGE